MISKELTDGGLDYTFECIGNVKTMVCNNVLYSMEIFFKVFPVTFEKSASRNQASQICIRYLVSFTGFVCPWKTVDFCFSPEKPWNFKFIPGKLETELGIRSNLNYLTLS